MITETDIRNEIRGLVEKSSKNEVAERFGVKPTFIHSILKGEKRISERIATELGYRQVLVKLRVDRQYEKISA